VAWRGVLREGLDDLLGPGLCYTMGVTAIWVLLGVFAILAGLWTLGGLPQRQRKRAVRIALGTVIVVGLVLLVRVGQPWLAATGAILLAVLRWLAPTLLRLLPFLLPLLGKRRPSNSPADSEAPGRAASRMTRAEALEVLGLAEGATDDEVRAAYSELIKKVHPDRGGTAYLAARVNLARDLLLGGRK
jgi:DnaJ homolog subfamily C member 19